MPPRKQPDKGTLLLKLRKEVSALKLQVASAQERASSGRTRHSNKIVATDEEKLRITELKLKELELELGSAAKRHKRPLGGDNPPSKRSKVTPSLSARDEGFLDEEVLDMELELLEEQAAARAKSEERVLAEHIVNEAAAQAASEEAKRMEALEVNRAATQAAAKSPERMATLEEVRVDTEDIANEEATRTAEEVRKVPGNYADLTIHEAATRAAEQAERIRIRIAELEAERVVQERIINDANAHAATEGVESVSKPLNKIGTPTVPEGITHGASEENITAGIAEGTNDVGTSSNQEKSTGNRSFGSIAAKVMFSLIAMNSKYSTGSVDGGNAIPEEITSTGRDDKGGPVTAPEMDWKMGDEMTTVTLKGANGSIVNEALYTMNDVVDNPTIDDGYGGMDCWVDLPSITTPDSNRDLDGGKNRIEAKMTTASMEGMKGANERPGKVSKKLELGGLDGEELLDVKLAAEMLKKLKTSGTSDDDESYEGKAVWAMLNRQKMYSEMTPEEKKALDGLGSKQIRVFLRDRNKSVDPSIRLMLRDVPDYLPQSAVVSRDLTCHLLMTHQKNIRCLYHIMNRRMDKSDLDVEAATKRTERGELSLMGVSGRAIKTKEDKLMSRGNSEEEATHLDCGCGIEEAIFHFWMWKTWRLHGMKGAVVEPINASHIGPRLRNSIHQGFQRSGALPDGVDALFAGALRTEAENRETAIVVQLRSLIVELAAVYTARNEPFSAQTLLDIVAEATE